MTEAHRLYNLVVATNNATRYNYLELGKLLSELKENDSYREAIGSGIETWNQFLKQPEISLSISEADKLIDIYQTYVVKLGFDEEYIATIPLKNLKKLLDKAHSDGDENMMDLLEQAKTLSDSDFKEVLVENDNITERTYTYQVMRKCKETGNMTKVHGIESGLIRDAFQIDE